MGWPTFRVTFKASGEANLVGVVVYVIASGADTAVTDARTLLNLPTDQFEAVDVERYHTPVASQKT